MSVDITSNILWLGKSSNQHDEKIFEKGEMEYCMQPFIVQYLKHNGY